ncbi:MAG: universal stress protein [Balneolaceae bacterium]|nr:MAG: universal stress protein [Balneolaceae bacterium]
MIRILVPIDFSDRSKKALEVANTFASLFDGKVTPFYSHLPISELDEPYALGMSTKMYQKFDEIEQTLTDRVREISKKIIDGKYLSDPIVSIGNAAQGIIDSAEDFDYVIMSSHGRTGFSRFLLGSVAEKVLRLCNKPVMIVENDSNVNGFKKILVTTDFSENSIEAFPYAIDIAKRTGAELELLHVLSFDQFDEEEKDLSLRTIREERLKILKKEYFNEIADKVTHKLIVSQDSPHEAIHNYVKENPVHLLVMATVGRTGLKYLMMGSTTANVVRHVRSAVLSVKPQKA